MATLWDTQGSGDSAKDDPLPAGYAVEDDELPAGYAEDTGGAEPGMLQKALAMLTAGGKQALDLGGVRSGAAKGVLTMTRNAGDLAGKIPASVFTGGVTAPGEKMGGPSIADLVSSVLGFKADMSKPLEEEKTTGAVQGIAKALTEGSPAMVGGGLPAMAAGGSAAALLSGKRAPGSVLFAGAANAALGKAGEMLGDSVAAVGKSDLVTSAVNKIINMPAAVFKREIGKGRNAGLILKAEGMPGEATKNVATMFDWVSKRTDEIGKGIDDAVAAVPQGKKVAGWQIVDDIARDTAKKVQEGFFGVGGKKGRQALLEDIENVRKTILGSMPVRSTGAPASGLFKGGIQIEPLDVLTAKRAIGSNIDWKTVGKAGGKPKHFIENMKADIFGALGDELGKLSPELRKLNSRYSSMLPIKSALEAQRAKFLARGWPKLSIESLLRSAMGTKATMALSRGQVPGAAGAGALARGAFAGAVDPNLPEE